MVVVAVLLGLIFAALVAIGLMCRLILQRVTWHNRVSTPWFNSVGQKIGLDNAHTISVEPPG